MICSALQNVLIILSHKIRIEYRSGQPRAYDNKIESVWSDNVQNTRQLLRPSKFTTILHDQCGWPHTHTWGGRDFFFRTGLTHPMWGHGHRGCHPGRSSGITSKFIIEIDSLFGQCNKKIATFNQHLFAWIFDSGVSKWNYYHLLIWEGKKPLKMIKLLKSTY